MTVIPPIEFNSYDFIAGNESEYVYDTTQISLNNGVSGINQNPLIIPFLQNRDAIPLTWIEYITIATTTPEFLRMQVSINGYEWWYWDEFAAVPAWTKAPTVSSITNTMAVSAAETNLPVFAWDVADGDFYWRFWILDNAVNLTNVSIKYKKYYASLKETKDAMNQFQLMKTNVLTNLPAPFVSFDILKNRMPDADAYIYTSCQRDFYHHSGQVEWQDGNGTNKLVLRWNPITNITYLVMYNQLLQAMRTFLASEIILGQGGEYGEIFLPPIYPAYLTDHPTKSLFGNIFINGNQNVEINYDWGYHKTPVDIASAAKKLMIIYMLNDYVAFVSKGANSRSIDGYSESFGAKNPFNAVIDQYQKEVDKMLARRARVYARFA